MTPASYSTTIGLNKPIILSSISHHSILHTPTSCYIPPSRPDSHEALPKQVPIEKQNDLKQEMPAQSLIQ